MGSLEGQQLPSGHPWLSGHLLPPSSTPPCPPHTRLPPSPTSCPCPPSQALDSTQAAALKSEAVPP